jgi:hypothetical protein
VCVVLIPSMLLASILLSLGLDHHDVSVESLGKPRFMMSRDLDLRHGVQSLFFCPITGASTSQL